MDAVAPLRSADDDLAADGRCALCGGPLARNRPAARLDDKRLTWRRCGDCGLIQLDPRPTTAEMSRHYGPGYYVFDERPHHRWARAVQQYAVHLHAQEGTRRRMLDVGCARGHLAALAGRRGWDVTGLDVSTDAVSQARSEFGIDARAGTLGDGDEELGRFDVVFAGDVIEHVPDPAAFAVAARRRLVDGGLLCLDTPNWGGRWRRLGGSRWLGLNRFHVQLFDAASLSRLLRDRGFQIDRVGSYTHYRYELPGSRPELGPIVRRLPWRAAAALDALAGRLTSTWGDLRATRTESLESACDRMANSNRASWSPAPADAGDNLVVHARAG